MEEPEFRRPSGIDQFWLKSLLKFEGVGKLITERDREVLQYLISINKGVEEKTGDLDLIFHFRENPFFKNKQVRVQLIVDQSNDDEIYSVESDSIQWHPN